MPTRVIGLPTDSERLCKLATIKSEHPDCYTELYRLLATGISPDSLRAELVKRATNNRDWATLLDKYAAGPILAGDDLLPKQPHGGPPPLPPAPANAAPSMGGASPPSNAVQPPRLDIKPPTPTIQPPAPNPSGYDPNHQLWNPNSSNNVGWTPHELANTTPEQFNWQTASQNPEFLKALKGKVSGMYADNVHPNIRENFYKNAPQEALTALGGAYKPYSVSQGMTEDLMNAYGSRGWQGAHPEWYRQRISQGPLQGQELQQANAADRTQGSVPSLRARLGVLDEGTSALDNLPSGPYANSIQEQRNRYQSERARTLAGLDRHYQQQFGIPHPSSEINSTIADTMANIQPEDQQPYLQSLTPSERVVAMRVLQRGDKTFANPNAQAAYNTLQQQHEQHLQNTDPGHRYAQMAKGLWYPETAQKANNYQGALAYSDKRYQQRLAQDPAWQHTQQLNSELEPYQADVAKLTELQGQLAKTPANTPAKLHMQQQAQQLQQSIEARKPRLEPHRQQLQQMLSSQRQQFEQAYNQVNKPRTAYDDSGRSIQIPAPDRRKEMAPWLYGDYTNFKPGVHVNPDGSTTPLVTATDEGKQLIRRQMGTEQGRRFAAEHGFDEMSVNDPAKAKLWYAQFGNTQPQNLFARESGLATDETPNQIAAAWLTGGGSAAASMAGYSLGDAIAEKALPENAHAARLALAIAGGAGGYGLARGGRALGGMMGKRLMYRPPTTAPAAPTATPQSPVKPSSLAGDTYALPREAPPLRLTGPTSAAADSVIPPATGPRVINGKPAWPSKTGTGWVDAKGAPVIETATPPSTSLNVTGGAASDGVPVPPSTQPPMLPGSGNYGPNPVTAGTTPPRLNVGEPAAPGVPAHPYAGVPGQATAAGELAPMRLPTGKPPGARGVAYGRPGPGPPQPATGTPMPAKPSFNPAALPGESFPAATTTPTPGQPALASAGAPVPAKIPPGPIAKPLYQAPPMDPAFLDSLGGGRLRSLMPTYRLQNWLRSKMEAGGMSDRWGKVIDRSMTGVLSPLRMATGEGGIYNSLSSGWGSGLKSRLYGLGYGSVGTLAGHLAPPGQVRPSDAGPTPMLANVFGGGGGVMAADLATTLSRWAGGPNMRGPNNPDTFSNVANNLRAVGAIGDTVAGLPSNTLARQRALQTGANTFGILGDVGKQFTSGWSKDRTPEIDIQSVNTTIAGLRNALQHPEHSTGDPTLIQQQLDAKLKERQGLLDAYPARSTGELVGTGYLHASLALRNLNKQKAELQKQNTPEAQAQIQQLDANINQLNMKMEQGRPLNSQEQVKLNDQLSLMDTARGIVGKQPITDADRALTGNNQQPWNLVNELGHSAYGASQGFWGPARAIGGLAALPWGVNPQAERTGALHTLSGQLGREDIDPQTGKPIATADRVGQLNDVGVRPLTPGQTTPPATQPPVAVKPPVTGQPPTTPLAPTSPVAPISQHLNTQLSGITNQLNGVTAQLQKTPGNPDLIKQQQTLQDQQQKISGANHVVEHYNSEAINLADRLFKTNLNKATPEEVSQFLTHPEVRDMMAKRLYHDQVIQKRFPGYDPEKLFNTSLAIWDRMTDMHKWLFWGGLGLAGLTAITGLMGAHNQTPLLGTALGLGGLAAAGYGISGGRPELLMSKDYRQRIGSGLGLDQLPFWDKSRTAAKP